MIGLPNASTAVTVKAKATPAVALDGTRKAKPVMAPAEMLMSRWKYVIAGVTVSVAVKVCPRYDLNVTLKVWLPASAAVNVYVESIATWRSVLVNASVPR